MPRADLAQPGILDPIPAQARYLSCQLRMGAQPLPVLQALASQTDGRHTVVGLGASLVQALGARIKLPRHSHRFADLAARRRPG